MLHLTAQYLDLKKYDALRRDIKARDKTKLQKTYSSSAANDDRNNSEEVTRVHDVGVKFHFAGRFINARAFDYAAMLFYIFERIEIFNMQENIETCQKMNVCFVVFSFQMLWG